VGSLQPPDVPVVWERGTVRVLPSPTNSGGIAFGISGSGEIVGWVNDPFSGATDAASWDHERFQDLGIISGQSPTFSEAMALNNHGQIVGISRDADGHLHCFLWYSGTVQTLDLLDGDTDCEPLAINDSGDVVGFGNSTSGMRPMLWHNGVPFDLTAFVPATLRAAYGDPFAQAINNRGQILIDMGGKFFGKTIILTPTPNNRETEGNGIEPRIKARELSEVNPVAKNSVGERVNARLPTP